MLVDMMCPNCRAKLQFDDSKEAGFCPYCGGKITRSFQIGHDQPNVFISYSSINPAVRMVTRIVSTGVKNTYAGGQAMSFRLAPGPQTIVLKIGRKNYARNIVVPSDNTFVKIHASFNGRAHIAIDQPSVNMPQATIVNAVNEDLSANTTINNAFVQANAPKASSARKSSKALVFVPVAIVATAMMLIMGTFYKNIDNTHVLSNDVGEFGKVNKCRSVDVTGMALSDAKLSLEDAGFTNLRGEPFDEIENNDNWIVTAQSTVPGSLVKSDELIQLDCARFDDYVNTVYTGKNINYIQKLADKSGFGIKYQDASANELDLTSLSDDVKKDVIASSACQYNDIAKTAIVTVAYTGDDQSVVLPVLNEGTTVKAPEATVPTEAPTATPTPTSIPTPTPIPKNKITKLTIATEGDIELHIGEPAYKGTTIVTLKYPNRYIDTKVVFVSEHPEVATIKNLSKKANTDQFFEISPVGVGETYVYAKTSDGYITSNRIKVIVKGPVEAESVSLNEEDVTLYVGDSLYLYAYITPTNAANKKITWSSSDTSVVTVTLGGVVKAVSCGDAEVTATTSNGLSATCYVSVIMDEPEEEYYDSGDYYYGGDDYDYDGYYDDSYEEYYEEDYYTEYVWLSATGTKYHNKPNCGNMNPDKARQVTLEEAESEGYDACKKCFG